MGVVSFPKLGLEFSLKQTAFSIFGISIQWYAILIGTGFLLAMAYILKNSRSAGVHPDRVMDVLMGGLIGAIVGARAYFVIFQWEDFAGDIKKIFNTRTGGLAFYGGLIGGLAVGLLICKLRKVQMKPMLDLVGVGFLIGQSIGRWGNFVNIEAFGSNTNLPWGMTSPSIQMYLEAKKVQLESSGVFIDPTMPVHPCFLYESIWCVVGFIVLASYYKKRKFDGEIFLMYVSWYGLGRFFIEGLRTDSLVAGNFRVSQILSALLCIVALGLIIYIRGKIKRNNDPDYLKLYGNTEEAKEKLKEIDNSLNQKKNAK